MTFNTMHCLCEGLVSDVCYFAPKWDSSLTVWIRAWLGGSAASTSPHTWVFVESLGEHKLPGPLPYFTLHHAV